VKAGWEQKSLTELASFSNGLWKGKKGPLTPAIVLRSTNFRAHGQVSYENVAELEVEEKQLANRQLHPLDIVLERSGGGPNQPVGRVILFDRTDGVYSFSNFTSAIRVTDQSRVDPRYLHQVLNWWHASGVTEKLQSRSTGIRNLDFKSYKALTVPLPPLEEQQRIVAILDDAFEGLARAKANAEANLASAKELFAQRSALYLFDDGREPEHRRLGSIVNRLTNGYVGPTRDIYLPEGVPYLLARHVRDNVLTFDGKTYVSDEFNEKNRKSKLARGDVLLVQSGHIGHCAEVPEEHEGHNCHAMIVLSPKSEILTGAYLSEVFNTPVFQEKFQSIRTGSTVPHLTCKMVKELMIPVCPLERQGHAVEAIRHARLELAQLTKNYKDAIVSLDQLRQSLLAKGFAGDLT
tara:strand:+ start:3089 stop:4309 length:1221 start_codon:yes stop_codon:yes gene_type:complete